jgi:hypothetical protein
MAQSTRNPEASAKAPSVATDVARGTSPQTPFLALTGVGLFVGLVAAAVIALALVLYFVV